MSGEMRRRMMMAGEVLRVRETSPDEAETSFRELDDVFLQTQTRIWLGEVLHERFDEEMAVADLLSDGELLFQVSKAVWKMVLKKNVDIRHSKFFIYERTSFGKADGRYMAYPKIDSFLKICQILGMTSIDLFSPSDVVEKRDIRRVCMCIRSLSKKTRLMKLNIPDFDIVTYTIAMPTGLVGGLRRSLELSRRSSSSSKGSSASMVPRGLHKQKNFSGSFARYHDTFSESDEGESTHSEFEFQSPSSNASSPNMSSIIGESSPEDDSILRKDLADLEARFHLDYWYQNENDLHWKSFGSNLSGDIDGNYDINLEIAEKEYEPFGCLSCQAQTIKWNHHGHFDDEKSKCSDLPLQSSNNDTFYMPETQQRCNNFHKLSNTGVENVSLEEEGERKQNGKPSSSPILTSDYSSNRNTSTDNYVDLMTSKSGTNVSDMENDCIALPDSIISSCRPYFDMKAGDLMLRDIKHSFEGDIIDEVMHCEIPSQSSLSVCASKTINRLSADKDYICETEDCNDILRNSAIQQSACVIEGETNRSAFHGMGITEVSNDLFAPQGRTEPSAGYHTSTNSAIVALVSDQSRSCMDGDTIESSEPSSSSDNKEEALLGACEYAPAHFGSDSSSDDTLHANSAFVTNDESCVSVVHKDQRISGSGGLIEDANGRVAPGMESDGIEPNATRVLKESCICGNVDFNSTCCGEAKLERTSQGELPEEPVACQDSVIESSQGKTEAGMYCSTLFSAGENEVNAKKNIEGTNQPDPVDNMEDNRRHNLNAAPACKTIEGHEKEVLRMHELNGKNKSRESPNPGNIVLKSVVGGITLVGATFLFLHFRGRRGKGEVNGGLASPKVQKISQEGSRENGENDDDGKQDVPSRLDEKPPKTQETNHSSTTQKPAEMGKRKVFYPGDKLKF